jgi:hypothetical protein
MRKHMLPCNHIQEMAMRLFKVDAAWPEEHRTNAILAYQCAYVTQGEKGPGLYMRDKFIPVEPALAAAFGGEVTSLPLLAARLDNTGSTPVLRRDTRGNIEKSRKRDYYGDCLVYVSFQEGTHQLLSSCFGETLKEGHFGSRVVREYLPLEDSEGVEAVALSQDRQEALLCLKPAASFRIHRTVRGKETVVVVSWNGRRLRAHIPRFHEMREPRKRNRNRKGLTTTMSEANPQLGARLADVVSLAARRQG